jgi:hypothetical protein
MRTIESDIKASLQNPQIMGADIAEIAEKLDADAAGGGWLHNDCLWRILLQKSKTERCRKSRRKLIFSQLHHCNTPGAHTKARGRFCRKRCGPSYRHGRNASAALKNLGRGIGRQLMRELIDVCAASGFRQMIGYIGADKPTTRLRLASIRLTQGWAASGHRLTIWPPGPHRHGAALSRCRFDRAAAAFQVRSLNFCS